MKITRRNFISSACLACAGAAGMGSLLEACSTPLQVVKLNSENQLLKVGQDRFAAGQSMVVVRSSQLENDILLVKSASGYTALNMKCTHEGYSLTPTAAKIYCNAHGSVFDFQGNVVREPALKPLHQFKTEIISNEIIIHLT